MTLHIRASNMSDLAPASMYEVKVQINDKVLWWGTVGPHERADGPAELIHLIAHAMMGEQTTKDCDR